MSFKKKKKLGLPSLVQSLSTLGNPLEVQWLGLHTPTAGSPGSVPGWSTEIPYAVLCGQKKRNQQQKKKKKKNKIFQKTNHKHCWSSLSICIWCSLLYSFSLLSDFLVVLPNSEMDAWFISSNPLWMCSHSMKIIMTDASHRVMWCSREKAPCELRPLGDVGFSGRVSLFPCPRPLACSNSPLYRERFFSELAHCW